MSPERTQTARATRKPGASFEIRDVVSAGGGLRLELCAEGGCVASARAEPRALADLDELLGVKEGAARVLLENALVEQFERELAAVQLTTPSLVSTTSGKRFVSRYAHPGADSVVGVVWYDPASSATGPEQVPVCVRSKMRTEVERGFAERRRSAMRVVLDMLEWMSA